MKQTVCKDCGKPVSAEHVIRCWDCYKKVRVPWNKGKTDVYNEETLKAIAQSQIGRIPWNKGKKGIYSDSTLECMRMKKVGLKASDETKVKMSKAHTGTSRPSAACLKTTETRRRNNGSWFTDEDKAKISSGVKARHTDPDYYNKYYNAYKQFIMLSFSDPIMTEIWAKKQWSLYGKTQSEYPFNWTEDLRTSIRNMYNYECQICGKDAIAVHHIDYNKYNCNENNLILLCGKCHAKTNSPKAKSKYHLYFNLMKAEEGGRKHVQETQSL